MTIQRDSAGRPIFTKDPDAILDYGLDWSDYLGADTITNSVATITGGTITAQSFNTTTTSAFVSGGVVNTSIVLSFKITTAGGRTDERSIVIKVKEL